MTWYRWITSGQSGYRGLRTARASDGSYALRGSAPIADVLGHNEHLILTQALADVFVSMAPGVRTLPITLTAGESPGPDGYVRLEPPIYAAEHPLAKREDDELPVLEAERLPDAPAAFRLETEPSAIIVSLALVNALKATDSQNLTGRVLPVEPAWDAKTAEKMRKITLGEALRSGLPQMSTRRALGLIRDGADVHIADFHGRTALHFAAAGQAVKVVKALLAAGASTAHRDHDQTTPLQHVRSSEAIFSLLLAAGSDVNATNRYGYTPLTTASKSGQLARVNLLIASGADLTAETNNGDNALALAVREGHREVARSLVLAGAPQSPAVETFLSLAPHRYVDDYAAALTDFMLGIAAARPADFRLPGVIERYDDEPEETSNLWQLAFNAQTHANGLTLFGTDVDLGCHPAPPHQIGPHLTDDQRHLLVSAELLRGHQRIRAQMLALQPALTDMTPLATSLNGFCYRSEHLDSVAKEVRKEHRKLAKNPDKAALFAQQVYRSPEAQRWFLGVVSATTPHTYAFDKASKSIQNSATKAAIKALAGRDLAVRKFKLTYADFEAILPTGVYLELEADQHAHGSFRPPKTQIPADMEQARQLDTVLSDFSQTHDVALDWLDTHKLPACLLRHDMIRTAQAVVVALDKQGVRFEDGCEICIGDHDEDSSSAEEFWHRSQTELHDRLPTTSLREAFARLVYSTAKQRKTLYTVSSP